MNMSIDKARYRMRSLSINYLFGFIFTYSSYSSIYDSYVSVINF